MSCPVCATCSQVCFVSAVFLPSALLLSDYVLIIMIQLTDEKQAFKKPGIMDRELTCMEVWQISFKVNFLSGQTNVIKFITEKSVLQDLFLNQLY